MPLLLYRILSPKNEAPCSFLGLQVYLANLLLVKTSGIRGGSERPFS